MEATRRAVNNLQDGLVQSDAEPAQMTGKQDPYLLRLAADRQLEKQIDEENYLHQAYLNLEASGRELEAIVVGEIQKSYNAYAGILKREADAAYSTVEELRTGPIAMPKDHEWNAFVENDEHFVDPRIPVRNVENIYYPGRDSELASEVRAGLLERKSKYLKSYTAGWYVLSPTHLHEFKSADKTQAPIMSLYLPEQKLGSHSSEGASSNKFMLKGRQTGPMHRGHSWVFRAESHDTMMAWVQDIKSLTEKSPQERNAFVRQHARSISGTSQRAGSISSDGVMDEEDEEPFSATASAVVAQGPKQDVLSRRPEPGGRFPSDILVNTQRGLQAPLSPSSGSSGFGDLQDHGAVNASVNVSDGGVGQHYGESPASNSETSPTHAALINQYAKEDGVNPYTYQPIERSGVSPNRSSSGLAATTFAAVGVTGVHGSAEEKAISTPVDNPQQQNQHDTLNPSTIIAPGIYEQQLEQQAARESATIAAPDVTASLGPVTVAPSTDRYGAEETKIGESQPQNASHSFQISNLPRPSLAAGQDHTSVQSVSQLHVPGEYPRNNPDIKDDSR